MGADELYRPDGQCRYVTVCRETDRKQCDMDPEACEIWDAMYDGECQADEVLSE